MRNRIILVIAFSMLLLSACKPTGEDVMNITTHMTEQETTEKKELPQTPSPSAEKPTEASEPAKETEHGKEQPDDKGNQDGNGNSDEKEHTDEKDYLDENEHLDNLPMVSGVSKDMLKPGFWLSMLDYAEEIILSSNEIAQYNISNFNKLPFLTAPEEFPVSIAGKKVLQYIKELSVPSKSVRYDETGRKYQTADYEKLEKNLNVLLISEAVKVQYGLTVKRTLMRTWPANKEAYENPRNMRNDMFVETAVYPLEPVAIYHTSEDGKWYFAQIYNYMAWISANDVALCSWNKLEDFLSNKEQLIIKEGLIHTPASSDKRISNLQLDMGVALPLKYESVGTYAVDFPLADANGNLEFAEVLLPKSDSVQKGYLGYTTKNVLEQAFKFLGEDYGWGGMNNARDCSAFILDVYRSFGIKLPRNTGQQEQVKGAISLRGKSRQERLAALDSIKPGSALYMPGHTMMYLGKCQNRHYIIHDAATVYEKTQDGSLKPMVLYQVAVTTLDVYTGKGVEYLMALTSAVEFR